MKKNGNENLKTLLDNKANGNNNDNNKQLAKKDKPETIFDLIQKMTPAIQKALPSHLDPNRLARIVTTEIRRNPKLLKCKKESLLGALMLSAQLGLEPGPLGHCYYVPYKDECQFIIGYKGMIDLARRSGQISSIYAEVVCENDEFEYELGLNPTLVHKPNLKDRGAPIAYYGVAKFRDGGYLIHVMSKEDVEKRRQRSAAAKSSFSPWVTDYNEMAKKTVIRSMFKYLPVSPEVMEYGMPDEAVIRQIKETPEGTSEVDFIEAEVVQEAAAENRASSTT